INEPLPDCERNFAAILDETKGYSGDDDYEDPELQMVGAWQTIKILPARPIKESEYADTRYFKSVTDTPLPSEAKTSIPTGEQSWSTQMRLEVDKPISKDIRSQHVKGDKSINRNKTPLPPPRPPVSLLKKYQPLPLEPERSRSTFPQRGPRQISLKDLSEP
uniref:Cytokine dependent hematopoietic cell linker n=1 Tax=Propithecus coquereli TaxID=379532 RepID=A0A2K6G8D3_PROCO